MNRRHFLGLAIGAGTLTTDITAVNPVPTAREDFSVGGSFGCDEPRRAFVGIYDGELLRKNKSSLSALVLATYGQVTGYDASYNQPYTSRWNYKTDEWNHYPVGKAIGTGTILKFKIWHDAFATMLTSGLQTNITIPTDEHGTTNSFTIMAAIVTSYDDVVYEHGNAIVTNMNLSFTGLYYNEKRSYGDLFGRKDTDLTRKPVGDTK